MDRFYTPPVYLARHFHLLPDWLDVRHPRFKGDTVLIWDPRPTVADPHGSVWGVPRGDWRFRAALNRLGVDDAAAG